MSDFDCLHTPSLLLDLPKLQANGAVMRDRAERLGVRFRPHVKTHKSIDVLKVLTDGRPDIPIMVSTLKEAGYFVSHGVTDIIYGVGIAPGKLPAIAELNRGGAKIAVILDDVDSAKAVADAGRKLGVVFDVHIEIDADGHRSGVEPDAPELIDIGRILHAEDGACLAGVLTHAGDSYDCASSAGIIDHAELERCRTVLAANALKKAGLPCPEVSVGSTPTATFAQNLDGVSELRAGVYTFQDLFQAGLGVCQVSDIAISVLTTVIGRHAPKNRLIIDAGWMAMSRDRGTASQAVDQGYGLVCDLDGHPISDLIVKAANQEHGIVEHRDGSPINLSDYPIGRKLRILPNHACSTASQYSQYTVVKNGRIIGEWGRVDGWAT